jgi:hypothetical protein
MNANRFCAVTVLVLLVAGSALGQTRFTTIREAATEIDFVGTRGIGEGSVARSFEAFWFELEEDTRISMAILVTEEREGVRFTDEDSMLFLFDSRGKLLTADDDGGPGSTSRIDEILLEGGERYYAVVTTFPNEPETTPGGVFDTLGELGSSDISFELHIRKLRDGETGKRLMGMLTSGDRGMAILQEARPFETDGSRGLAEGIVGAGHEIFTFEIAEASTVSLEVNVTDVYQGTEYRDDDSMLFLFDSRGSLIAEDDDGGVGSASALRVSLENSGRYYVAVTTYDNSPELDDSNRLIRFPGTGESSIRFLLELRVR